MAYASGMFARLTRREPWKTQIGCSFVVALIVAAPGLFIGYMTYVHDHSDKRNALLIFAGVWLVVAVLVLLSGIHQLFASRSPETIVEIEPSELVPGASVRIRLTQPGPLRLLSLHANLAGEETQYYYARGPLAQGSKRTSKTRYFGPYRMLEVDERRNIEVSEQWQATFVVPPIASSKESTDLKIRWNIEVWGRVALWPDFMHPFPIKVVEQSGGELQSRLVTKPGYVD